MKFNLFFSLAIAVLLCLVTNKIVYYGFTPNYAADIFSRKAFNGRFDHDVYKYRIFCKYLLFKVDDWLGQSIPARGAENRILVNTPNGSQRFYMAFYYLNTFFLILTSILVVLLLDLQRSFQLTEMEKNLVIFFVPVLIGLTEFVVCCYDISSYFFQLLILYVFLRFIGRRYLLTLCVIGLLIILSTLNRESSALSVSMVALLLLGWYGLKRKAILGIGAMAFCFLITYAALRYFIVDDKHMYILNLDAGNLLSDINFIGLLFWGLFFYLPMAIARTTENRWLIGAFFLFSLPYVITCLKDGVFWEVRLYMPLFLGSLFLSQLDASTHVLRITDLLKARVLRTSRREIQ